MTGRIFTVSYRRKWEKTTYSRSPATTSKPFVKEPEFLDCHGAGAAHTSYFRQPFNSRDRKCVRHCTRLREINHNGIRRQIATISGATASEVFILH